MYQPLWPSTFGTELQRASNRKPIKADWKLFSGPISLIPFEEEDAKSAGRIRAELEVAGRKIGAYDLLIAGQAMRHKLKLVTANGKEFGRVKGLDWEDWAKS